LCISYNKKNSRPDIAEILLKLALNTNQSINQLFCEAALLTAIRYSRYGVVYFSQLEEKYKFIKHSLNYISKYGLAAVET